MVEPQQPGGHPSASASKGREARVRSDSDVRRHEIGRVGADLQERCVARVGAKAVIASNGQPVDGRGKHRGGTRHGAVKAARDDHAAVGVGAAEGIEARLAVEDNVAQQTDVASRAVLRPHLHATSVLAVA